MARSKRTTRRENKRYGHKQARQATRHVLEDGANPRTIHGTNWSSSVEQAPLNDEAILKPVVNKKKGCKRNKYGPHVVEEWERVDEGYFMRDDEGRLVWKHTARWHFQPNWRCQRCGKGFWQKPKTTKANSMIIMATHERRYSASSGYAVEPKPREKHDDYYNVRMREIFGDERCECIPCNSL